MVGAWQLLNFFRQRINSIVYSKHFAWILMILLNDGLTRQFAHTHDAISMIHSVFLNPKYRRIYMPTTAVEISSMHMNTKWFSRHLFSMYTRRIGQPIVCMDDIEIKCACYNTSYDRIVVDFFVQISGISSCKLHTSQVVDMHVIKVSIDVIAQLIIEFCRHNIAYARLECVGIDIAPCNRHTIHGHDVCRRLVFIAKGLGQAKRNIHVALDMQSFGDAIVGRSQTTINMRGIFPSKH